MCQKIKGYWSFNKVREEALKFTKRSEFNKLSKSAYLSAHRNGWLDVVCSHMKTNDYTFNRVREEALKYLTRNDFKNKSNAYYNSAHRNGWLDDVCSHMKPQGNSYKRLVYKVSFDDNSVYIGITYNLDKRKIDHLCRFNSAVYKHMIETGLNPNFEIVTKDFLSSEDAARLECKLIIHYKSMGFSILNRIKGGGLGGNTKIWTIDNVRKEASKYNSRSDFKLKSASAYVISHKNGWLDDVCSHMNGGRKINGYWNIDMVRKEASKYNSKKDFSRGSSSSYQIAIRNGWLDCVCSHMLGRKIN